MTIKLVEERARRSEKAKDWTPELVLEELLEQMRSGETEIDRIVIVLGYIKPDGATSVTTRAGGTQNAFETMGMLYEALHGRAD